MKNIKRISIIGMYFFLILIFLTSCSNTYADDMFELYQKEQDKMISRNADIIPLGQYDKCNIACFHEKHGKYDGELPILTGYSIASYWIKTPCKMTWICAYNRFTEELVHISKAYEEKWISDEELLHIFYEYDQASEKFSDHSWHKSENFIWDLEEYRKK